MDENISDGLNSMSAESLLRNIMKPDYPDYIVKLLEQTKGWLTKTFQVDGEKLAYWEMMREYPDMLFNQLSWIEKKVALLPAETPPPPQPEAVVVYLGEVNIYDSMRLAVDYSLIFSKGQCRRIWVVTDCWIPGDVMGFKDHIAAMVQSGITLRFVVITHWGWIEMPLASLAQTPLPPGENGRGRRHDKD